MKRSMPHFLLFALAIVFGVAPAFAEEEEQVVPPKPGCGGFPGIVHVALDVKDEAVKGKAAEAGKPADPPKKEVPRVGMIKLSGSLREGAPPFALMTEAEAGPSLRSVIGQLRHVATSDRHKGVVFFLDQVALNRAQIDELTAAVKETRKAGKKVLFFAEAYDMSNYLLACSGDQILLQQNGFVELTGAGVEEMYLAGLFEKIGIKPDFVQTGKFKGADEQYMRKGPSKEWSQNMDGLLDDLYDSTMATISKARKIDRAELEKAMENALTMRDTDLVKAGLIDRATTRDILDVTKRAFGDDFDWDDAIGREKAAGNMDMENPFAMLGKMFGGPAKLEVKRNSIALIEVEGVIMSGNSSPGGFLGGSTVGSNTIIKALKEAKSHPLIKGVVMRINSPGGSALASEVMWQQMRDVAKVKPVWVSVGSLAASGGYYLSCGADKVYASPQSIVGSIGVVSGKLTFGGLYEWAGVGVHRRSRGPLGDMFNSVEPFTPEQKKALTKMSERIYEQFTERVKKGRGEKVKDIDAVAQGRLFTGNQAEKNGLIDKIGGVEIALGDLAKNLKLEAGQYDVITLPEPAGLAEMLSSMFGVTKEMPKLSAEQMAVLGVVKSTLGPRAWPAVRDAMQGVSLLRDERVLTIMPHAIVVK